MTGLQDGRGSSTGPLCAVPPVPAPRDSGASSGTVSRGDTGAGPGPASPPAATRRGSAPSPSGVTARDVEIAARALAGADVWDQHSEPARESYRRDAARVLQAVAADRRCRAAHPAALSAVPPLPQ